MTGPADNVPAKAATYRAATLVVNVPPTMPRRPETEMIGSVTKTNSLARMNLLAHIGRIVPSQRDQIPALRALLLESARWIFAALCAGQLGASGGQRCGRSH